MRTGTRAGAAPGTGREIAAGPAALLRQARRPPPAPRDGAPEADQPDAPPDELLAVRVLDNPVNTYQEVIDVCLRALPVTEAEAFDIAYAIDHEGSCVVCVAPRAESERVAATIRGIGIEVRLEPYRASP